MIEYWPFVLSLDMIWLLISQGFARHVQANPEKLPTDADKAARAKAMEEATLYATQIPLETMKASLEVFPIVKLMAKEGNPNSVSDAGVGALVARATVQGAFLNVKINASELKDCQVADKLIAEAIEIAAKTDAFEKEVVDICNEIIK